MKNIFTEIKRKDLISYVTLFLAFIAIIISFRSCYVAKQSLEITQKQYFDKFKTIWSFKYIKEKEVFEIEPTNKDVILQKGIVYYPDSISDADWPIRLPENYLYIVAPKYSISRFVKTIVKPEIGHSIILDNGKVPIVLESYYTLNGDNFH